MSSPSPGGGPLEGLGRRFLFNNRTLEAVTEGFLTPDWRHRFEGGGNPAAWIVGHVAYYRRVLLRALGEDLPEAAWEGHFHRGVPPKDPSAYPPPAEMAADFAASGERLARRLAALTAEQAAAPFGSTFADGSSDLDGGAHFLHFHESYHLGQIGYLRRTRGRPGIA